MADKETPEVVEPPVVDAPAADEKDALITELTQRTEEQNKLIAKLRGSEKAAKKADTYKSELQKLVEEGKAGMDPKALGALDGLPIINQLRIVRALSGYVPDPRTPAPDGVEPAPTTPTPAPVAPPSPHTPAIDGGFEREKQSLIASGHWNSRSAMELAKKFRK